MGESGCTGLVAVFSETLPLLDALQPVEADRWGESVLYSGQIADQLVALAQVLPGPVNGALGAQMLLARYGVSRLISVGSAGALDPLLSPGDLVIAERAIAHDAGAFLGRRFEPGGIMGRDHRGRIGHRRFFQADPGLVAAAQAMSSAAAGPHQASQAIVGTVVTGNQMICSTARKRWLHHTFNAAAVEMETAAVAQVAAAHRVPWVAVRGISDRAGDDLILDYHRLRLYLDDDRPPWRHLAGRWFYLLTHPRALARIRRLHRGLALAAGQAGRVVVAMLQV